MCERVGVELRRYVCVRARAGAVLALDLWVWLQGVAVLVCRGVGVSFTGFAGSLDCIWAEAAAVGQSPWGPRW